MSQSQLLYRGRITKVRFNLSGTDTARKDSYVPITSYDLFRNNTPYPGGVYDAHLGTTDHSYRCQTCYNNKRNCIGHEGNVPLNYPVWNPMGVTEGRKWLKLICFNCGNAIISETLFMRFPRAKRLDEASKLARMLNKKCIHCKEIHPVVKKDAAEPLKLHAEFSEEKRISSTYVLYPHKIAEVFARISDETCVKLGKSINSHPRNFVLYDIKVPPVTIRPDVKKIGGGRSTNDDLTTMLQIIIKKNESMAVVVPDDIDQKLDKAIWELNNSYYDFIKAGGDNAMNSLAIRLKGKQGRFRKNQMGKRVRNMCRSTIIGDPSLRINEMSVPLLFARNIPIKEIVQEYNKRRLLGYVQNGRKKYPGASKIVKKSSGAAYDIDGVREIELENGDEVYRDIIDGDPINFNRQPSLMPSNLGTHLARVHKNDNLVQGMNVIATPLYNADFDGDAMNAIISSGIASRNEISELSSVQNWAISHTTSGPAIGQVEEGIVGLAELTRTGVRLNKYHAMLIFQNTIYLPSFADVGKDGITGRDCISKILEETPLNFTRTPQWYDPSMSSNMHYDPSEIKVVIEQGKHISGILDKKSIGKGANGGLYHIICNEYSADKMLEVMFNMQQMAIAYMYQFGFTIGIMDLLISPESKLEIDRIAADIINKSGLITEKLNNGELIPPIGKTVDEFFESEQIENLNTNVSGDFAEPILRAINPHINHLFKLIMYGSKGTLDNLYSIVSSIGQNLINGKRAQQKFGFKRTLAYFPRFDTTPQSQGYIANSFLGGMNSREYVFNAMASRFDLISKALSTSVTGEQNRKSIKNLESIIINNHRWAVKNKNVIQFGYGEDFLDPRRVEKVKFPTVMISDDAFKAYQHADFPEIAAMIATDRAKYRKEFLTIENMNVKELMTDICQMPVNVGRIVTDSIREYRDNLIAPTSATLAAMVKTVLNLCEDIPYILINEIQQRLRSALPEFIVHASWLLTMLVRSHLHPNELINSKMTPMVLQIIVDKIKLRYHQALIDPGTTTGIIAAQSFSEPLTQYMLDAHKRSASGGTSNAGMARAKEILGAKPVGKSISPMMLLPVIPSLATNKQRVQEIANNIEVMIFHQFATLWQIYFEKFGEPVHSKTKHESAIIAEFLKNNPLLDVPNDLTRWCIRVVVNNTALILKNMSLDLIVTRLRESFPETFIVYTPENTNAQSQIIIRVYMRNTMFKGMITTNDVLKIKDALLDTTIRGVNGISNATIVKMIRNKVAADGSIVRNDDIWGIKTDGTNLRGVMSNPFIDQYSIHTDSIQEVSRVFGIEAARQQVTAEIRNLVDTCNDRHYLMYADEMTYTGRVTSIESSGLKTRESNNVLLRIGFSSPLGTLEEAAVNSMEDEVTGITSQILIGSVPKVGTLWNRFHVNEEFIRENVRRPDDILDDLLV